MGIIYCATNKINGKIYIGQTTKTLEKRKINHESAARKGSPFLFHNALRKYGFENFSWRALDEEEMKKLPQLEQQYIEMFGSSFFGYNLTLGGEGLIPTEEVIRRRSESRKGKLNTAEAKQRMSEAAKKRLTRKVRCIETGIVFRSAKDAGSQLGIPYKNIQRCCIGNRKHTRGYSWQYEGDK